MKIVVFNGPPGSGKDTAARALMEWQDDIWPAGSAAAGHTNGILFERFSMPFKKAFANMMNVGIDQYGNVEEYEAKKEEVIPLLGVSYRQWQIDFSEKFMKPLYGQRVFGDLMVERLRRSNATVVLIPDCGFQPELDQLFESYGSKNILLVRLIRPGSTFTGDSRGWVTSNNRFDIANDGPVERFRAKVVEKVGGWINGH